MKPIPLLFGLCLHWAEPNHPTKVRAYTGAARVSGGDGPWTLYFTDHAIERWYGVSFKLRVFFGWQQFGATTYPRETGELPHEETP